MRDRVGIDPRIAAIAEQQRNGARLHDERNDGHFGVARALQVGAEHGIESIGRCLGDDGRPLLARLGEEAWQIEWHADSDEPVAGSAGAEGVAPFRDVAMHEKERRIVEELAREIEEEVEQYVAVGRFIGFAPACLECQRSAAPPG